MTTKKKSASKKAASPKKAIASRANGAKSKGPKTGAGKARSAMNAMKHGVYSQSLILPNENLADLTQLRDYYLRRFQPQDPVELDLVEVMVISMWRLRRLARIDTGILMREFQSAGRAVRNYDHMNPEEREAIVALRHLNLNGNALSALDRQESKLYRHFSRAMGDLMKLRKHFPAPEDPGPDADLRNEPELTPPADISYSEDLSVEARQPLVTAKVIPICDGKAAKGAGETNIRRNRDALAA